MEEEIARVQREQAHLPVDMQRSEAALRFVLLGAPDSYQLGRFDRERCGICAWTRNLVLDHCHETGQVRGPLCVGCNVSEGRNGHPIFTRYRRIHPAAILDVHIMYTGFGWEQGWSQRVHRGELWRRGERPPTPWPVWSPDDPLDSPAPRP